MAHGPKGGLSLRKKQLLAGLAVLEVVSAVLAWRDLARRGDKQVRGNKRAWRAFMSINPGNSVVYWAVGRRRGRPGKDGSA